MQAAQGHNQLQHAAAATTHSSLQEPLQAAQATPEDVNAELDGLYDAAEAAMQQEAANVKMKHCSKRQPEQCCLAASRCTGRVPTLLLLSTSIHNEHGQQQQQTMQVQWPAL